jgi:integrase
VKLSAKELAAYSWPEHRNDCIVFDDEIAGFGLRRREGKCSWVFQYKIGSGREGVTRRIKIGDYPALSPVKARKEAEDLHAKVHLHGDPALERRRNRADARHTFGRLVDRYLDYKQPEMRTRSFHEIRRHLFVHAKPLHAVSLAAVDQAAIARLLTTVAKNGPVAANRTRASLSAMFAWAMGEGMATFNPVVSTNKREEKSRDRVLSDAELATVWHTLSDNNFGAIIKILMLTGQRLGEIAGLRWTEIDFGRELISLPSERTKNKRPHDIPMGRSVKEILQAHPRRDEREFVFAQRRGSASGGWGPLKRALDERGDLPHWTIHDIRRSVATGMADIGIQPHIIEAVLNHVGGHKAGVAGIYNRATYAQEKVLALARWDEHIRSIVEKRESKVVGIGRR